MKLPTAIEANQNSLIYLTDRMITRLIDTIEKKIINGNFSCIFPFNDTPNELKVVDLLEYALNKNGYKVSKLNCKLLISWHTPIA